LLERATRSQRSVRRATRIRSHRRSRSRIARPTTTACLARAAPIAARTLRSRSRHSPHRRRTSRRRRHAAPPCWSATATPLPIALPSAP